MKFRKKPIVVEATQWFKNGDHPLDNCRWITEIDSERDSDGFYSEGEIVCYSRHPAKFICGCCQLTMSVHGWIKTLEDGYIVCPGDWVVTGIKEHWPIKPDVFEATYERTEE